MELEGSCYTQNKRRMNTITPLQYIVVDMLITKYVKISPKLVTNIILIHQIVEIVPLYSLS